MEVGLKYTVSLQKAGGFEDAIFVTDDIVDAIVAQVRWKLRGHTAIVYRLETTIVGGGEDE